MGDSALTCQRTGCTKRMDCQWAMPGFRPLDEISRY